MEIMKLLPGLYDNIVYYLLIFTRIITILTSFMVFRRAIITGKIMLSLTAILSLYVLMIHPATNINFTDNISLFRDLIIQVFLGILSATILNIIFEIFLMTGQIISTQVGLSITSLIDPSYGMITSLSNFYLITSMVLFFVINGHLFLMSFIIDNFATMPISHNFIQFHGFKDIFTYGGTIFSDSFYLSLSVIIVVMLSNMALAVMTRFAPQFNIFSIGINLQLIIGLMIVFLTFSIFTNQAEEVIKHGLEFLRHFYLKA